MNILNNSLAITLQQARKARRFSQLELSLRLNVSQRHISFVESGRAKPSRELLIAWLQELDSPLIVCNAAMLQAGYAPAYSAAPLNDPALAVANDALLRLLHAHDPMPAFVIDAQWNLLHFNRGGQWLTSTLMPWATHLPANSTINMLDILIHPEGLTKHMVNLHEVGSTILAHLRDNAAVQPLLIPKVEAFALLLRQRIGQQTTRGNWSANSAPVMTTRFATPYGELAFFSMFTTFGTPQDITLASLRLEHMFAADETTRTILHSYG